MQKISFLVLRIMGSFIFITAGINHLFQTAEAAGRLEKAPFAQQLATWMAPAETLIVLSGVGLLLGGLLLLLGLKTRWVALGLFLILVPITLTVQVGNAAGSGPLFKNIALLGMLLFFMVNGSLFYGLDQWFINRKQTLKNLNVMKKSVYSMVLALLATGLLSSCATGTMVAQTPSKSASTAVATSKNYGVLISQPNHLKAAVNTAETITKDSKYQRQSFVVMACAKSVEAFVKGNEMAAEYEKGMAAGITYKVCGMSLKQFNIDPQTLVKGVEIVPNGLTYMFDLQQQGYMTVEL